MFRSKVRDVNTNVVVIPLSTALSAMVRWMSKAVRKTEKRKKPMGEVRRMKNISIIGVICLIGMIMIKVIVIYAHILSIKLHIGERRKNKCISVLLACMKVCTSHEEPWTYNYQEIYTITTCFALLHQLYVFT